jgi:hypothetical protein
VRGRLRASPNRSLSQVGQAGDFSTGATAVTHITVRAVGAGAWRSDAASLEGAPSKCGK